MRIASLKELYSGIADRISTVYVVPLIRYEFKKTDYLYLLYKDLITDSKNLKVISLSVFEHYKVIFARLLARRVILHYHWLEFQDLRSMLGMPYKIFCIWMFCLLRGKLVWTVHNLKPHDKKYLEFHRKLHIWMGKKASVIHVHSEAAAEEVGNYYEVPMHKIRVLPHPEFPADIIPQGEAQSKVLELYGYAGQSIQHPVFLIFGGLSVYKGINTIVSIMKESDQDFTMIIAGYVKKGQEDLHCYIIDQVMDDPRFIYTSRFIPDDHFSYLLSAADICPFNYDSILTSGGVEMARAYKRKIIAPRIGGIKEYEEDPDIILFDTEQELRELLRNAVKKDG